VTSHGPTRLIAEDLGTLMTVVQPAVVEHPSRAKSGVATTVSVAIVSFNTRHELQACLDSVVAEAPREIVVVDNASTDGTAEMVRMQYPDVLLLANAANNGYGAAANQAIKSTRGDYVLLLNADTVLTPGAIEALGTYIHRHPEAAVVGPRLQHPDGTPQQSYFPFPGTLGWFVENEPVAWLLHCLPLGRERFLCLTPSTVDRVVPWVSGAAFMLRRTAFEAVGGFDESYFMYFEEVDLCLRLRALQWRTDFTPTGTVVHVGGASASQCRTEALIAHFRSTQRFYRRHYSERRVALWMALMTLKIFLRLVHDLVGLRLISNERVRSMLAQQVDAWKAILSGDLDRGISRVRIDSRFSHRAPVRGDDAASVTTASAASTARRDTRSPANVLGLIWTLIRTDFKAHYHGTVGGFLWVLLKPVCMFLVLLGVFSFIFTSTDPYYRSNFILGLFLWEFFAEGTKVGLVSLWTKGYLLTKSRFPRWIVVATSTVNALITLLVFSGALLLYLAWAGRFPTPFHLLLFIAYEIEMWMIVLGFSLATSVLYLRYRDLNHVWDAISRAGFFVAPVLFPIQLLPESLHPYLYLWPPTPVIEFARSALIKGTPPGLGANLLLLVAAVGILAAGAVMFQRHAARAAEHL
jgi:N-acetylglucosaminyl-diphospho-decaprenol L-rhamnosyltransferase